MFEAEWASIAARSANIDLGKCFPVWSGFYGPHEEKCFYWWAGNDSCSCKMAPAVASNISLGIFR